MASCPDSDQNIPSLLQPICPALPCFSLERMRFQLARGLGVVTAQQLDEACGQRYPEYLWWWGSEPPGCIGPVIGSKEELGGVPSRWDLIFGLRWEFGVALSQAAPPSGHLAEAKEVSRTLGRSLVVGPCLNAGQGTKV